LSKLEQETEELKGIDPQQFIDVNPIVRTVDTSVSKAIASGRQQKGLTQKELATVTVP
jgi:ribosome-binding protein aMBF1 (putative translation factor)